MAGSPRLVLCCCLALLLLAACGGDEKRKISVLAELDNKVREASRDEERYFDLAGEVAGLRARLRNLENDPLRTDPVGLELRLQDTGARVGLSKVYSLKAQGSREEPGLTDSEIYTIRAKGKGEYLERWLNDVVSWEVAFYPVGLATSKDMRGGWSHVLTFALPTWTAPPRAPQPADPPDPGPEPEDYTESQIWRMEQNLARIEEARKVIPPTEEEKEQILAILSEIDKRRERSRALVEGVTAAVAAVSRAGDIESFEASGESLKLTVAVFNKQAAQDLLADMGRQPALANPRITSEKPSRVGLQVILEADLAPTE